MRHLTTLALLALIAAGPAAAAPADSMHGHSDDVVMRYTPASGGLGPRMSAIDHGKARADRYIKRGDQHFASAHYKLASEAYKIALQYDPVSEEAWEKHRKSFQMGRAIDGYVAKAEGLLEKGLNEEAASFLRLAVKLSPRDPVLWRLYERSLADNPHVVVITTEREAWDAFRRGREVLDGGRWEAAIRYFEEVLAFTKDDKLRYYSETHLKRAQERLRKEYPNLPLRVTDR